MEKKLEVNNLRISFRTDAGKVQAVRGIDFDLYKGETLAIVGESGSGKSVTNKAIIGISASNAIIESGEILYDGKSISQIPQNEYRLKYVSLIYQNFCLLPFMTVMENVTYPSTLLKVPKKDAIENAKKQLAKLSLDESYYKRRPHMLSGGEQQRVASARAMCTGAAVFTADEPTGNLDSANAQIIADILSRLAHEEGKTVIMVTHDLAMAERADVVIRLKDGRIDS